MSYEYDYNDFPFFHKTIHKNKSMPNISIEDINLYQGKIRINSPTTLKAMKLLGYNITELQFLSLKDYLKKNPNLIGASKQMQQSYYNYVEKLREERFNKIKMLRLQLKSENPPLINKRSQSCYRLKRNNKNGKKFTLYSSRGRGFIGSTALEKEKKMLERKTNCTIKEKKKK